MKDKDLNSSLMKEKIIIKLYDYIALVNDDVEVTVFDKEYDMEVYFYGGKNANNKWDELMKDLSKKLTVKRIGINGEVTVNLSDVIEKNLDDLTKVDLFVDNDIDSIMVDMENILAGNVSENWMEKFVECLR